MKHLTPAEYVIHIFQGVHATARAVGRTASTVCQWRQARRGSHGTDGQIPQALHLKILDEAKRRGLDIQPQDLVLGRRVSEKYVACGRIIE